MTLDLTALVTPDVLTQLDGYTQMAPLHQPHNLSGIRAIASVQPELPQVACFDTEFHSTQSWVAQAYALTRHITQAGLKRYGFHGLSYEIWPASYPTTLARRLMAASSSRIWATGPACAP